MVGVDRADDNWHDIADVASHPFVADYGTEGAGAWRMNTTW
jgi:hypothetical protein